MTPDSSQFGADDLIPFSNAGALADPEKLLAAYFRSSAVGVCIVDSQLRYLAINDTLAAMNGIATTHHIGKTIQEILGDAAGAVEPEFRRVFATGEPVDNIDFGRASHPPGAWPLDWIFLSH